MPSLRKGITEYLHAERRLCIRCFIKPFKRNFNLNISIQKNIHHVHTFPEIKRKLNLEERVDWYLLLLDNVYETTNVLLNEPMLPRLPLIRCRVCRNEGLFLYRWQKLLPRYTLAPSYRKWEVNRDDFIWLVQKEPCYDYVQCPCQTALTTCSFFGSHFNTFPTSAKSVVL